VTQILLFARPSDDSRQAPTFMSEPRPQNLTIVRPCLRFAITLAAIITAVGSVGAQPSSKRATATRLAGPAPRIDGRLDDAAWVGQVPIEDFEQQRPIEGAAPSERTQVFVRYDDDAIYVGARMYREHPDQILRSISRRDGSANSEHLQLTFDTHRDRRTGYAFNISAAGVRGDFHHSQDDEHRGREGQYDPVWEGSAVIDSLGWSAEMRIPFSQLRFPTADTQEWGFQLDRWMPDKNEDLQWIMIPTKENGYISRFGTLTGIAGVKARRPVELLPYVASDATRSAVTNTANPFRNPTKARAGLDAKFGIGSNLTVDATINPDFGQVESDPAEVNLSAFETIVEERRPFFTEGAQLLRVEGPNYFYSRRIGSAPHLAASGDFVDQPRASAIMGAAKLTGRTASRLSVGALLAMTDRTNARTFMLDSSRTSEVRVEPRTEYAVVRLQQEIGAQASTAWAACSRRCAANLGATRPSRLGSPAPPSPAESTGASACSRGDMPSAASRASVMSWATRWRLGAFSGRADTISSVPTATTSTTTRHVARSRATPHPFVPTRTPGATSSGARRSRPSRRATM